MTTRWSCLWPLLLLVLCLHGVAAGPNGMVRREDAAPTLTVAPMTTTTGDAGKETEASSDMSGGSEPAKTNSGSSMTTIVVSTSATPFPSAINGNEPGNSSSLVPNDLIPAGQLPLQPRLTPGWGVAGAILLISGIAYTLIGIKNVWLHTFLSTAFLAGLSVAVLIVYVMVPPIRVGIEGAYVVAAVVTGVILGGAATVFREITEGLGCLLGGFCFAMWLLTLKAGGLLTTTPTKVVFISVFSLGSYAFYFSHYTRPYALMGLMSFAGATVTVIGIDCFSKAGLKEFWVYIWNLNGKLFPYGVDTYPLTKGIRVEIAVTVVFTIAGVISQLKLWRVIQEHRVKKAEEQAEEQRKRDEEEAILGRQIETQNARERRQWEIVYGDQPPASSAGSRDSELKAVEDEKKAHLDQTDVRRVSSNKHNSEMAELPASDIAVTLDPGNQAADRLMVANQHNDSRVTIRVASDESPAGNNDLASGPEPDEKVWIINGNSEARPISSISTGSSPRLSKAPGPEITPLPFRIPDELDRNDDRSSIATYADDDDRSLTLGKRASRESLAKRLSVSSGNFLRSPSQRSVRSQNSKRKTAEFGFSQPSQKWASSTENLAESHRRSSDAQSIAATIDGMSLNDDRQDQSIHDESEQTCIPQVTTNSDSDTIGINSKLGKQVNNGTQQEPPVRGSRLDIRPFSLAETVGTDILDPPALNTSSDTLPQQSSSNQGAGKTECANGNNNPIDTSTVEVASQSSRPPKSVTPSTTSASASFTKEQLPSALSRVALSYRTNEWAKHLSTAEMLPLEQLQLEKYFDQQDVVEQETEAAIPVNIQELQQTPEDGISATITTRSLSWVSNMPQAPSPVYRSASRASSIASPPPKRQVSSTLAILTSGNPDATTHANPVKAAQPVALNTNYSFRGKGRRKPTEVYSQPILEEKGDDNLTIQQSASSDGTSDSSPNSSPPSPTEYGPVPGVVSYSSPQTLLGRREMFLRNKSQSQLYTTPRIQEHPQYSTRPASHLASSYSYTMTSPYMAQDADDLPLSQRKELMRQNSMLSINPISDPVRRSSTMNIPPTSTPHPIPTQPLTAESTNFDSHQPQRRSTLPSQALRDARLSNFRQSVAADLRAGIPVIANSGRETPLHFSASTTSLLGPTNGNIEVSRSIDQQRSILLSQREQEAQKREMERWEKERNDRAFVEMMQRGDFMDAHREALRRMQGNVKHG
ncbi:hypothetical protein F5Y19DRAFT_178038 [Xylariaceae sp. FL1651]|nr:hypothetical protein F5Y19DRAFT_178038 [Xylariaceae sp. FL1651]